MTSLLKDFIKPSGDIIIGPAGSFKPSYSRLLIKSLVYYDCLNIEN